EAVDVRGPRDADRTRIDVAEHVAARDAVGRADVHAGSAADAIQRLPKRRVGPHPGPSVVQDDHVELPPRRILRDGLTLGDQGHVHRHPLSGRADCMTTDEVRGILPMPDYLLLAYQLEMDL